MKKLITASVLIIGIVKLNAQNINFDRLIGNDDPANYFLGHYYVAGSDGLEIRWHGGIRLASGNTLVQMLQNGNVGIGTQSPDKQLTLRANSYLGWEYTDPGSGSFHTITGGGLNPMMLSVTSFSDGNKPAFKFNGYYGALLTIMNSGHVGIGTNDPQYKLDVKGTTQLDDFISGGTNNWMFHTPDDGRTSLYIAPIISSGVYDWGHSVEFNKGNIVLSNGKLEAREVKVSNSPGADFVFEEDYNLPTLESVEKHIKDKKHLPEIASAKDMEKDGVNVGEFQIKLLQKIEELTLYTIEQNKLNIKQQEEIQNLRKEIQDLKK